jgi:hypothetical protein
MPVEERTLTCWRSPAGRIRRPGMTGRALATHLPPSPVLGSPGIQSAKQPCLGFDQTLTGDPVKDGNARKITNASVGE